MKSRANRLQPAADLAHERQEAAMQRLAEQQQKLAKAEQQLEELQKYRAEYAQTQGGVSVSALLNRRQFVERIDQVIAQQVNEVTRQRRNLDGVRHQWREAHAREQALGSVIDRYREQERKSEERREQAEIDERMQYRRPTRGLP
ncbi:flagellar export protein FliJ [Dyella japonica]|uniref:Flagellar FliJ protein n=1 Tax=Dyella japonica A8 TaxID=1217721 RepID=A0A075K4Q0_9GAMM|nr:flagellar export protein FliJ [Dyella japonica]AIF49196.1 flagellar export protein FliJ [Dyella japonica A8]